MGLYYHFTFLQSYSLSSKHDTLFSSFTYKCEASRTQVKLRSLIHMQVWSKSNPGQTLVNTYPFHMDTKPGQTWDNELGGTRFLSVSIHMTAIDNQWKRTHCICFKMGLEGWMLKVFAFFVLMWLGRWQAEHQHVARYVEEMAGRVRFLCFAAVQLGKRFRDPAFPLKTWLTQLFDSKATEVQLPLELCMCYSRLCFWAPKGKMEVADEEEW